MNKIIKISRFNIRVYGLLLNADNEILVTDEERFNMRFTKFPGGGLEWGEGTKDCLAREWREELNQQIIVGEHFYTTDFFQPSAFSADQQLISIYYFVTSAEELKIRISHTPFDFNKPNRNGEKLSFRWLQLKTLSANSLTFPVDKIVAEKLIHRYRKHNSNEE